MPARNPPAPEPEADVGVLLHQLDEGVRVAAVVQPRAAAGQCRAAVSLIKQYRQGLDAAESISNANNLGEHPTVLIRTRTGSSHAPSAPP